jgi:integrase
VARCAQGGTAIARPTKPGLKLRGRTWHYAFTVAGRRFRGSTGERDRGRAESFLARQWYEAHRQAKIPVAAGPVAQLDLAALSALWLAQLREHAAEHGPKYEARHKLDTKYILRVFRLAGDVTDDAWKEGTRTLHAAGLSWRSLQHATVTLRHLMRFCKRTGAIDSVPELRPPSNKLVAKEQAPRRALSEGERDRMLAALWKAGDERPARIWAAMAYTGLRRSELRKLTLRWLETRAKLIRIPPWASKSGEEETVALHPKARQAIRQEAASREVAELDQPVFGGFDIRKAWARALTAAKVDKYGLTAHHSARHTFGTLLGQYSRGDVTAVMAGGRWRSLAMAQRYVHASAERARATIKRL